MRTSFALLCLTISLAACERQPAATGPDVQRVQLAPATPRQAMAEFSPDTSRASWQVSDDGQAIRFGEVDEPPLLTLACDIDADPPRFTIIRHALAYPGQGALFPVIGNGVNSRFLVDSTLADGEWHWEAQLPADDPQLEVFSGTRDIIATLPGRGTLEIEGGRITGEFLEWCRSGGRQEPVEVEPPLEQDD